MPQHGPILTPADFGDISQSDAPSGGATTNKEPGYEGRTSTPNGCPEVFRDPAKGSIDMNIVGPAEGPIKDI